MPPRRRTAESASSPSAGPSIARARVQAHTPTPRLASRLTTDGKPPTPLSPRKHRTLAPAPAPPLATLPLSDIGSSSSSPGAGPSRRTPLGRSVVGANGGTPTASPSGARGPRVRGTPTPQDRSASATGNIAPTDVPAKARTPAASAAASARAKGHGRSQSLMDIALPPRSALPDTPARNGHRRTPSLAHTPSLGSSVAIPLPTPSPKTGGPRPAKRQRLSSPARQRSESRRGSMANGHGAERIVGKAEASVFRSPAAEAGGAADLEMDGEGDGDGHMDPDLALGLGAEVANGAQAISRETFLANEALRRQREARNFVFEGDENAPKLTRSGKVIGARGKGGTGTGTRADAEGDEGEVDEYGARLGDGMQDGTNDGGEAGEDEMGVEDESTRGLAMDLDLDTVSDPTGTGHGKSLLENAKKLASPHAPLSTRQQEKEIEAPIAALPAGARPHVLRILETLNGDLVTPDSESFPLQEEEKNEALQGLLSLLRGTVERGEGNSGLITGARGVGKTRTVKRALDLLTAQTNPKTGPIVVRLSGHAQINDRLAIREMGRQILEAEGKVVLDHADGEEAEEVDGEYAPTTLPSHLLALLTQPSARAIIIIMEEFDMFTEHARQALLYCLLDVVQSIKTGPVETTGRGVAVIGITTRVDTLLLLEKRVKSRFSHRMWRVQSPLAAGGLGWKSLLQRTLVPWAAGPGPAEKREADDEQTQEWQRDWGFAVEMLLDHPKVARHLDRLTGLSTDVRLLYRPFILPVSQILASAMDFIPVRALIASVLTQVEGASWSLPLLALPSSSRSATKPAIPPSAAQATATSKLRGLPHPCLGVLIIAKHLAYAGREEWNFVQVEEEYLRFARTRLVGSGKVRWPMGVLRTGFDQLLRLGILIPAGGGSVKPPFARVRCTLSPHEIVAFFKGDGAVGLGPELTNWGRMMGGHA